MAQPLGPKTESEKVARPVPRANPPLRKGGGAQGRQGTAWAAPGGGKRLPPPAQMAALAPIPDPMERVPPCGPEVVRPGLWRQLTPSPHSEPGFLWGPPCKTWGPSPLWDSAPPGEGGPQEGSQGRREGQDPHRRRVAAPWWRQETSVPSRFLGDPGTSQDPPFRPQTHPGVLSPSREAHPTDPT